MNGDGSDEVTKTVLNAVADNQKPETEITQRGPPVKPPFKRSQVGILNGNSDYFVAEIFFNSFLSITCLITIWEKSNAKVVCPK